MSHSGTKIQRLPSINEIKTDTIINDDINRNSSNMPTFIKHVPCKISASNTKPTKLEINDDNKESINNESNVINLIDLISVCYALADYSGYIVKEAFTKNDLHVHDKASQPILNIPNINNTGTNVNNSDMKDDIKITGLQKRRTLNADAAMKANDPQTMVDILIQNFILKNIRNIFKNIIVIGEEDESDFNKRKYLKDIEMKYKINTKKITIDSELNNIKYLSKDNKNSIKIVCKENSYDKIDINVGMVSPLY